MNTQKMTRVIKKPALWLLILIVGLPQLSETVYTPSLPDIAHSLSTSDTMVEYTLSIYLFAFALGTLLWGRVSDRFGRKMPLILGLGIYVIGCIGCALSSSIEMLLLSRFVQAFGGSTGSILGQVICRDVFQGKERGIVFSSIGVALSISPAIGPLIGGVLDEVVGWRGVFAFLIFCGVIVSMQSAVFLPETHPSHSRTRHKVLSVLWELLRDPKVLIFGAMIGGLNGIMFSYYGEGSFYLIEMLGLSPFIYGLSFILLAGSAAMGCKISSILLKRHMDFNAIIMRGLLVYLSACFVFMVCAITGIINGDQPTLSITLTLGCMCVAYMGMDITKPSLLSHALEDYQHVAGTASSLFGFYYYLITALTTFIMASLRNGTLTMMPLYFFAVSVLMVVIFKGFIARKAV
jgi:DHA1 family bicyclomycin/chloramphenicol resistance-like MFS transporter